MKSNKNLYFSYLVWTWSTNKKSSTSIFLKKKNTLLVIFNKKSAYLCWSVGYLSETRKVLLHIHRNYPYPRLCWDGFEALPYDNIFAGAHTAAAATNPLRDGRYIKAARLWVYYLRIS